MLCCLDLRPKSRQSLLQARVLFLKRRCCPLCYLGDILKAFLLCDLARLRWIVNYLRLFLAKICLQTKHQLGLYFHLALHLWNCNYLTRLLKN